MGSNITISLLFRVFVDFSKKFLHSMVYFRSEILQIFYGILLIKFFLLFFQLSSLVQCLSSQGTVLLSLTQCVNRS